MELDNTIIRNIRTDIFNSIKIAHKAVELNKWSPFELSQKIYLDLYSTRNLIGFKTGVSHNMDTTLDSGFVDFVRRSVRGGFQTEAWTNTGSSKYGEIVSNGHISALVDESSVHDKVAMRHVSLFSLTQSFGFISRVSKYRRPGGEIFRIYMSITPKGAPWVIGSLFDTLEDMKVIDSGKCLAHPKNYKRMDAAVLYCYVSEFDSIMNFFANFDIDPTYIRQGSPLGTYPIIRGVNWAAEPSMKQKSYGLWLADFISNFISERENEDFLYSDFEDSLESQSWRPKNLDFQYC